MFKATGSLAFIGSCCSNYLWVTQWNADNNYIPSVPQLVTSVSKIIERAWVCMDSVYELKASTD